MEAHQHGIVRWFFYKQIGEGMGGAFFYLVARWGGAGRGLISVDDPGLPGLVLHTEALGGRDKVQNTRSES